MKKIIYVVILIFTHISLFVNSKQIPACGLGYLKHDYVSLLDTDVKQIFESNCKLTIDFKYELDLVFKKNDLNRTILSYYYIVNLKDEIIKAKILKDLVKQVNKNNNSASLLLANIQFSNLNYTKDIADVLSLYESAALGGYGFAYNQLGLIYFDGKFVEKNIDKSEYYFQNAVHSGIVKANYNLGLLAYEAGDFIKARSLFKKKAGVSSGKSLFNLAIMNKNGEGGEKNLSAYQILLHKSAEHGFVTAMKVLGKYLLSKKTSRKGSAEGIAWLKKAFESGDLDAGFFLAGYRLTTNRKMDKNGVIENLSILKIVVENGNLEAIKMYVYKEFEFFSEHKYFYDKEKFEKLLKMLVEMNDETAINIRKAIIL